jgi:hypothetical protein
VLRHHTSRRKDFTYSTNAASSAASPLRRQYPQPNSFSESDSMRVCDRRGCGTVWSAVLRSHLTMEIVIALIVASPLDTAFANGFHADAVKRRDSDATGFEMAFNTTSVSKTQPDEAC